MEYDSLLQNMAERWDMTPAQLENVMGRISYHESKDDPYVYQTSGGPGRGLFQFEEGDAQGGATAANRLITTLGDTPDWLAPFVDSSGTVKSINAAKLTPEQQKMLFLGNYRQHPEASLKGVNDSNIHDFWGKYHWAGAPQGSEAYNEKIQSFNDSQNYKNIMQNKTIDEQAF